MGELDRLVAKRIAENNAITVSDHQPRNLAAPRRASSFYVPGMCSKTRREILFACELQGDSDYICTRILAVDRLDLNNGPRSESLYTPASFSWRGGHGLVCPCCGIKVNNFRGSSGTAAYCDACDTWSCLGGFRVAGNGVYVTCGRCGDTGLLGGCKDDASTGIVGQSLPQNNPAPGRAFGVSPAGVLTRGKP